LDAQLASIVGAPRLRLPGAWKTGILIVALVLAMPVLVVFSFVFDPAGDVWRHLYQTVLANYVVNSLILMLGVAIGTLTLGVSAAWITTNYRFPLRSTLEWALLLPMAMPAFIIAYTYTGVLDYAGPVQMLLRDVTGWSYGDYWFPQIRSLGGAICMLSLVLYPYVYLLARMAFLQQPGAATDISRSLGCGRWCSFFRVSLPSARPAILAGLSLVLMETLADYGTVQYFGVDTFTTGIFRTWFGLGDAAAASQLAAMLMVFVFVLILAEQHSRRHARYYQPGQRTAPAEPQRLSGSRAWLAFAVCLFPLLFGFVLPALQLGWWAWVSGANGIDSGFFALVGNTMLLAAAAALLALVIALFLAYGRRQRGDVGVNFSVRLAGMGYAVPGTVIAVGVMLPLAWFDNQLDSWMREHFDISTGLLMSGTLFALMFAYMVRFLAVSLQTVEAGLGRIRPSMDEAARSMGYAPAAVLRKIHIPILRTSLLTAVLLVFVDVMKELPATLILRPFNFNTLAVRAYELASDERLMDASAAALTIVLVGILPVILLSRSIGRAQ